LHNVSVKILAKTLLAIVFLASLALVGFLLHTPKEKETWATLTGLLAVIAAVIAPCRRFGSWKFRRTHCAPAQLRILMSRAGTIFSNFG
jgi:hypothetical protein